MSKHTSHKMHLNSLATFNDISQVKARLSISKRIEQLMLESAPMTDKEIAVSLGFDHRSHVQPRISDLIRQKVLVEFGTIKDPDTGKPTRLVCIAKRQTSFLEGE